MIPPRKLTKVDGADIAIEAKALTRRFGDFTAVDHVSFRIERGEIFGFLGSNGCGKTTTMKMLTGLLPASEGTALLFGHTVDARDIGHPQACRLHVAVVLALWRADACGRTWCCMRGCSICRRIAIAARVAEMVERFGLSAFVDQRAGEPAAGHAPAPVAGGGGDPPAGNADPRRADLGRRSGRARRILAPADRAVAQRRRHHLHLHPLHERGRALRPHLAHACRTGAGAGRAGRVWSRRAAPTPWNRRSSPICRKPPPPESGERRPAENDAGIALPAGAPEPTAQRPPRFSLRRLWAYARRETHGDAARSDPPRLRAAGPDPAHDRLRLRHLLRCREALASRAGPRPVRRKPRLHRELFRFALLRPCKRRLPTMRIWSSACAAASSRSPSKSLPASAPTCRAGGRPRSASGSMARCRSRAETSRGYVRERTPGFCRQSGVAPAVRAGLQCAGEHRDALSLQPGLSRASSPWCPAS